MSDTPLDRVDALGEAAGEAALALASTPGTARAELLTRLADALDGDVDRLVPVAERETHLAVPRLRIVAAYDIAPGTRYRIDSFEAQRHSPLTDHAFFVNLMPDALMSEIVQCLNDGRSCQ